MAPRVGLEPTTYRLTAGCSTIELPRNHTWRRLTFPGSYPPSIISAEELNFRVRDGNGCVLFAIATRYVYCRFWTELLEMSCPNDNAVSSQFVTLLAMHKLGSDCGYLPSLVLEKHLKNGVRAPSKLHRKINFWSRPRPISITQLNALLHLHM